MRTVLHPISDDARRRVDAEALLPDIGSSFMQLEGILGPDG
jgi:hypothetical protein